MTDSIRDRIIEKLLDHVQKLKEQGARLSNIATMLYTDSAKEAELLREDAIRANEDIYLGYKVIEQSISGQEVNNLNEKYGEMDNFPVKMSRISKNTWLLHLPTFSPLSTRRKKAGDGKFVYYLVFNLLIKESHAQGVKKLNSPLIIFEHHILPGRRNVFDFDNVDSKSALDAMQGFFFTDDNAFSVTTIHTAKQDDKSYTNIYVTERPSDFLSF